MSFPDEQATPPKPSTMEETAIQRVRRRRASRRSFIPADAEGQASLIADLARRAYPSIELFVFSLACGAILGLGFLLNSQAVLLLGILVAPLMTPWVGFLLAVLTGSPRFLFETVMALFIGGLLVFLGGLLTGFAARLFLPITLDNVYIHSRLWVPALVVIALGAVTLVASFARSESKPFLPSVIIAYAFYLPVNASGFGLAAGLPNTALEGLLVFGVHFALAGGLGLLTLLLLRLRPTPGGAILSVVMFALFAAILFGVAGAAPGSPPEAEEVVSAPSPEETALPAPTATPPPPATNTSSPTSAPTVETPSPAPLTLEITLPPTETPTVTPTPPPTPVFARIQANEGGGANMRETPGGAYMMTLLNGTIVETYSEFQMVGTVAWVKIYVIVNGQRVEGWVLESTLAYATPAPNFEATATSAP